jgi:hypothetical protein
MQKISAFLVGFVDLFGFFCTAVHTRASETDFQGLKKRNLNIKHITHTDPFSFQSHTWGVLFLYVVYLPRLGRSFCV